METQKYESFYNLYRDKLNEQYPSVNQEDVAIPPVSPFLITLSQNTVNEIKNLVKTFYKVAHLRHYQKIIQTDKLCYLDLPVSNSSLLMSYDFHLDQGGDLKLIEINTHSSGYLVSDLVDQTHQLKKSDKKKSDSLLSLKKSFEEEWKNFSGGQSHYPSNILIADHQIKKQKMYIEFLMYKDLLNSWGWRCHLHEIRDLNINSQGMLVNSCQEAVQMIYNRCTDFYFESLPNLKKAFLNKKCCISPHPGEYLLLADKMRFCEWSSDSFLDQLNIDSTEKAQIKKAVPFTAPINSVLKDELWKKRKKLFFKPLKGYGGKSVYSGKSISHTVFGRMIESKGIFQEMAPPPVFVDPSGVKWKYDIRAYVYKDQVQKLSARVYQGQLTQFRTALSGFAAIRVQK